MNDLIRDQSEKQSIEKLRSESITFVDVNSGKAISLPIVKSTYQCIVDNNALGELDIASIVRGFYEKAPRKSIPITINIGNYTLEKNISAIAFGALFNCNQDEINYLVGLPGLLEEIDSIVIDSMPKKIRPSTNKQRKFADEICRVLRIELNDEIKNSKEKLSKFISSHVEQFEREKDEVYSNLYVCRVLAVAMDHYCLDDKNWKPIFNTGFNIYAQLAEYEQNIIVKDLINEIGDKYWVDVKNCYLSQIISEVFAKSLTSTEKKPDYAEQFDGLVGGCHQ